MDWRWDLGRKHSRLYLDIWEARRVDGFDLSPD
jgi:hypothetical protein